MMDICNHDIGLAFEMHIKMALANEVPRAAIKEVIFFHSATEAGYPSALAALVRFKEISNTLKLNDTEESEPQVQQAETQLNSPEESLDPRLDKVWKAGVMQQWSRPTLTEQERTALRGT
jgi:hypothetical protein